MRNITAALKTDEESDSLEQEEVQIIEELVIVLGMDEKMLPALRDVPRSY